VRRTTLEPLYLESAPIPRFMQTVQYHDCRVPPAAAGGGSAAPGGSASHRPRAPASPVQVGGGGTAAAAAPIASALSVTRASSGASVTAGGAHTPASHAHENPRRPTRWEMGHEWSE
jgi:hypothetical protein